MATYAALIYNDPELRGHQDPAIIEEYQTFMQDAQEAGVLVSGHPLEHVSSATTVQVDGGQKGGPMSVTDGPYAETKEILAGFFLLRCDDLDAAVSWAARIPGAWHGRVEVRPVAGGEG